MTSERKLLESVLKLTRTGPIAEKILSRDAGIPTEIAQEMLEKFRQKGLIEYGNNVAEASPKQRVNIAIQAIKLGADLVKVGRFLEWLEFENITAEAFEANRFSVQRRFRFNWTGRRWEIDVLACREPLVVCLDCKRWRRGWGRSAIAKAVEAQMERTKALAAASTMLQKKIPIDNWRKAVFTPAVASLVAGPLKFHRNAPVVPIMQLQNFIDELPAHLGTLAHYTTPLR